VKPKYFSFNEKHLKEMTEHCFSHEVVDVIFIEIKTAIQIRAVIRQVIATINHVKGYNCLLQQT